MLYRKKATGSARRSAETNSDSQSPSINFSMGRNLNLDALDEKFYEILRHKLKIDIKDNIVDDHGDSDKKSLDQSFNQSIEGEKITEEKSRNEDGLIKGSPVVENLVNSDEEMTEAKVLIQIGMIIEHNSIDPKFGVNNRLFATSGISLS